ncbi:DUF3784 domain-containing protein [Mucilaginibacter sp. FT3.2]|uniref:DUF3784 domain-containing protein n=1 Tax=Mucilaginibacter sp. FT3.2 TaxID=2723090 RepID=UPI0016153811|nr:DUF3784 domain-containing protein [Mucilaginibacter sp. FT3.2]MBB6233357.1 hypothetical protein [Mucilaginibacter sp. FT3.2]
MFNLIVFGVIALVMLLLGYQIKYKKKASLISGFNEDLVTDVNGLCNWVGGLMLINAAIAFSTGILMACFPTTLNFILIYFVGGIMVTCIFAVMGTRKFKKKF